MRLNRLLMLLTLAVLLTACSDDDDGPAVATSPSTGTPPITNPATSLNAFTMTDNAFASTTAGLQSTCSAEGEPAALPGTANYTSERVYCAFANQSSSMMSLRGTYFLPLGMMCALEKAITFNYSTTPTMRHNITLSESDPCFGASGFDSNNDGDILDNFSASIRERQFADPNVGYSRMVEMQAGTLYDESAANNMVVYLNDANDVASAKSYMPGSITEAVIDRAAGTLHYESRDYVNQIHMRTYIQGTMDPTSGAFLSTENVQMIQAGGTTGSESGSIIYATDGTNTWADHYIGTTQAPGYGQCMGDCTALVIPYNADFHNFTANPQNNYDNSIIMTTTSPLTMTF